jgi:PLP dependent protein
VKAGDRDQEIALSLARVRSRIAAACVAAGRSPADVTLVVVTKTYPVEDVERLIDLGVRDVGENRDQEAAPKAASLLGRGLVWHFVGQLQRNKARSVLRYADVVHTVDRDSLVTALSRAAEDLGRRVDVLLQVDLDDSGPATDRGRGGVAPSGLGRLADLVAESAGLDLRGVMAVAPHPAGGAGGPSGSGAARPAFERLAELSRGLRASHPAARWISAGMSADLEDAVSCGATHLRVGSSVLGPRARLG